jgi:hypothetical protein
LTPRPLRQADITVQFLLLKWPSCLHVICIVRYRYAPHKHFLPVELSCDYHNHSKITPEGKGVRYGGRWVFTDGSKQVPYSIQHLFQIDVNRSGVN